MVTMLVWSHDEEDVLWDDDDNDYKEAVLITTMIVMMMTNMMMTMIKVACVIEDRWKFPCAQILHCQYQGALKLKTLRFPRLTSSLPRCNQLQPWGHSRKTAHWVKAIWKGTYLRSRTLCAHINLESSHAPAPLHWHSSSLKQLNSHAFAMPCHNETFSECVSDTTDACGSIYSTIYSLTCQIITKDTLKHLAKQCASERNSFIFVIRNMSMHTTWSISSKKAADHIVNMQLENEICKKNRKTKKSEKKGGFFEKSGAVETMLRPCWDHVETMLRPCSGCARLLWFP